MPEFSGLDFLREVKKVKNFERPLKKIVITAFEDSFTEKEAEELEIFSYLVKSESNSSLSHSLLFTVKKAFQALPQNFKSNVLKSNILKSNYYITEIELLNIKCFEKFHFCAESNKQLLRLIMILGDNATGKTTLLRCIALGLCEEGDAISLMKQLGGSFLRKNTTEGYIKIKIKEDEKDEIFTITTTIKKENIDSYEVVRQSMYPYAENIKKNIFIVGYGPHRNISSTPMSYEDYIPKNALKSLFDYSSPFQNPELVLLRQEAYLRKKIEDKLKNILMLDAYEKILHYDESGIDIEGHWGKTSYKDLSDGYQSTSQWILDFLSWAIYAGRFTLEEDIGGIVLIDEIEQHLHPKWQKQIIGLLTQQFPKIQFITSTHSPLCTIGTTDLNDTECCITLLQQKEDSVYSTFTTPPRNKRADQVLTSYLFDLYTTSDNAVRDAIEKYYKLYNKKRNKKEDVELKELKKKLNNILGSAETDLEDLVEKAVSKTLISLTEKFGSELEEKSPVNYEIKRQLKHLFNNK